jgi:hypothetical protein
VLEKVPLKTDMNVFKGELIGSLGNVELINKIEYQVIKNDEEGNDYLTNEFGTLVIDFKDERNLLDIFVKDRLQRGIQLKLRDSSVACLGSISNKNIGTKDRSYYKHIYRFQKSTINVPAQKYDKKRQNKQQFKDALANDYSSVRTAPPEQAGISDISMMYLMQADERFKDQSHNGTVNYEDISDLLQSNNSSNVIMGSYKRPRVSDSGS